MERRQTAPQLERRSFLIFGCAEVLPAKNGPEYRVTLHSPDEIHGNFGRSCNADDHHISLQLRIDFRTDRADNALRYSSFDRDGVAVFVSSGNSGHRGANRADTLDSPTSSRSNNADGRVRPGAHHLSEPACTRVHTSRTTSLFVLYVSCLGCSHRCNPQDGTIDTCACP